MTTTTKAERIEAIKAKMKAHHITQKMVAESSGYTRDYIGEVVRNCFSSDFAISAIEEAVDQLIRSSELVFEKPHTIVSEMSKSVETTMFVMSFFKTHRYLTARAFSRLMAGSGRDIGIRQCQRVLQSMCGGGLLLQVRRYNKSLPIKYTISPTARELMTGGAA